MKNKIFAVILVSVVFVSLLATTLVLAANDKVKDDLDRVDFIHYKKPLLMHREMVRQK
jgi:hypothetical protein